MPSNGEGIKNHLGAKVYWPIYQEAEKLGCALAVHVGSLHHLGMDGFSTCYPVHALGHPFGIAIQAASIMAHGIFDKFSKVRVAFLERGSTWVPFFIDRLDRSYHAAHLQVDLHNELVGFHYGSLCCSDASMGLIVIMLAKKRYREGADEVAFHVRDRCSTRRHDLR